MTRKEFGEYVQQNYEKLFRFVKSRVTSAPDAEDVLQKTLLKLLLICHTINTESPDGFFFTALRNGIIDYWRKRGRRPAEMELPEQLAGAETSGFLPAEDQLVEDSCRAAVREAAAGLTERERHAFTAYWQARGDRVEALEHLGASAASKEAKYKVYDGPLYHAKRKLCLALLPQWETLADIGYFRVWQLVYEVLCGESPDAASS
jgi:RNA polymerase sigma factor (sigma-70 family)